MSTDNKQSARRIREEIWNNKNFGLADEIVDADCVHHIHDPLTPSVERGPSGLKKLAQVYMSAFPDARITIEEMIADGDRVMVRWSAQATHSGALMQIAPTGRRVLAMGVDVYRFANGKLQDHRIFWDAMGFAGQLGLSR